MILFRVFLATLFVIIAVYTSITIATDGLGLVPLFFGEMLTFGWQGQFNLDFLTFLLLTGLWVAWRGGFTGASIGLGLVASVLGMVFLSAYLLVLSYRERGEMQRIMMGVHADRDA
jgi:FtsH-binding integral membrane protein